MLTLVMPMGGRGSRFSEATDTAKPLIDVYGLPMFLESFRSMPYHMVDRVVFIVGALGRDRVVDEYRKMVEDKGSSTHRFPECVVVPEDEPQGICHSLLLAKEFIDPDGEVLICHSDQHLVWRGETFLKVVRAEDMDAALPIWSTSGIPIPERPVDYGFAVTDNGEEGLVRKLFVKKSSLDFPNALCGVYYFRTFRGYVEALHMLTEEDRVGELGEFHVESIQQRMIETGYRVGYWYVDSLFPMGTPEELEKYTGVKL